MFRAYLSPSSGGTTVCILRISCASSWFFFTRMYRDAPSTKHKILITSGRKVYKIQATFNLHLSIKYGFQHIDFNVTHNCIMALSAEWKFCLTSWYDPRFMPCSNNILYDDPLLGKIKFGLSFMFRRSPARMIWTEMECFIWELSVRSPCNMPCRHGGKVKVKLYTFLTSVSNGGRRTKHLSGCLVLGKEPRYPLYGLGGHDGWSERVWRENLLPPPNFEPQTCSPRQFTIPTALSRPSSFSTGPKYRHSLKLFIWQQNEINEVAYPPNNIQILRITHRKYSIYS